MKLISTLNRFTVNMLVRVVLCSTLLLFIGHDAAGRIPEGVRKVELPVISAVTGNTTICNGARTILTASSIAASPVYNWYDAAVGGNLLFTGASFNTPILTANKVYYVDVTSGGNTSSARTPVSVTVTASASPALFLSSSNANVCVGGSSTLSTQSNGLVGYWKMDEGSGSTVTDYSGNNLTGYFRGNPSWSNAASIPASSGSINMGTGYNSNYIEVNDASVINTMQSKFTIEAWIKMDGTKTDNTIIDRGDYNFLFQAKAYSRGLGFYNPYGGWSFSDYQLPYNEWIHVACTWEASTGELRFYVNGVQTDLFYRSGLYFGGGPINIARQSPSTCRCNPFAGNLDEIRIWNVVRSRAEIQATMSTSLPLSSPATFNWSPSTGLNTSSGSSVVASPSATTTYTVTATGTNGCVNTATTTVNVYSSTPVVNPITGNDVICMDTTTRLNTTTTGGRWSSSNTSIANVNSDGLVTPVRPGTAVISYSIAPAGCGTISANKTVTVNALPELSPIMGLNNVCPSSDIQLSNTATGGQWSINNTNAATINPNGLLSTADSGSATVSYKVINENGCVKSVTKVFKINAIQASFTKTATCVGLNNGTATVSIQGGGGKNYAITGDYSDSKLLTIDLATGATTEIGRTNAYAYFLGLAVSPSGDIYATADDYYNPLWKIDPLTGNATPVALNIDGNGPYYARSIVFDNNGVLYLSDAYGYFYTVDLNTNSVTNIGYFGYEFKSLQFDPTNGQLYALTDFELFTIDLNNLSINNIGNLYYNSGYQYYYFTDMIFDASGNLYVVNDNYQGGSNFLQVDKSNANVTFIEESFDGAIYGLASGGTSYTYLWDNGQTSETATGLTVGEHTVVITSANGCSLTRSVIIDELDLPKPVITVNGPTSFCVGGGSVSLTAPAASSYQWSNGQTTQSITVTSAGNYTVTVPGASGCLVTSNPVSITTTPAPTVNPVANQEVCHNAVATTAINFSGAIPGTVYNWINNTPSIGLAASGTGDIASFVGQNTGNTPVTATITVTPSYNGCVGTPVSFTIRVNPIPVFAAIQNQTVCAGSTTTPVTFVGQVAGTTYSWFGGASVGLVNGSGNTIPSFTTVNTGNAPVTASIIAISNYAGATMSCGTSRQFNITVNPVISASISAAGATTVCPGSSVVLQANTGNEFTYQWKKNGDNIINATSANYTATSSGDYSVVVTANGCSSNPSNTIAVHIQDNVPPVVPVLVDITAECAATVTAPITTDACSGQVTGTTTDPLTYQTQGEFIIHWTFTDASGNSSFAEQKVIVRDVTPPTIQCVANITITGTSAAGAVVNYMAPTATDNCTGVTVTQTAGLPSGSVFPMGTTTVTYTATDAAGLTASCSFTVTVSGLPPVIVCPANITVSNDAGQCGAVVNFAATDNTAIPAAVISYTKNGNPVTSGSFFAIGTHTIVATSTNAIGTSSCTFTVTVKDTEKPNIQAPGNQVTCASANGNNTYTVPAATAADNCGIATVMYTVTGGVNRTGTGLNASGVFGMGASTITWTVTDVNGNTHTAQTTVTVNPLPVASYVSSNSDAFCNKTTVTGASSINAATYSWSTVNAAGSFSANPELSLGLGNADGNYYLFVKATASGCVSARPAVYNYQKQNVAGNYTILAYKEVELGKYNKVATGSVGVLTAKGEAEFKSNSAVNGPGAFVKAPRIDKDGSGIGIPTQIIGVANVSLPVMQYNNTNTNNLPNFTASVNNATLTGNYKNLTIKKGISVTVTNTTFGTIKLEEGASVRFTNAVLNIGDLVAEKGAKNNTYSYIRFAPNTSVRVSAKVSFGSQVLVNPDNYKVTFYMGDNRKDEEKFTVKGGDTRIIANIYMPDGKLRVTATDSGDDDRDNCDHKAHTSKTCRHKSHDHNDCDHKGHSAASCEDDVYMTGLFIAEEVESKGNTVIWNSFDCTTPAQPVAASSSSMKSTTLSEKVATVNKTEEDLKVTVMPNPSTTYFTLKLESKNQTPVELRIIDAGGRVVDARSKLGANSSIQVGHNYNSGIYYAEFIQGTQRKVVRLIKSRG
ncbi:HYR domain-containing protein [Sediminibacterium goheungense]|uniref:HYR domain-containing protein n=1 Tax=Sediminibacterium goheungense TaxID=1086393 RepID=A0A4R6IU31_9BACT|nr:HYR domain-containing protein [Sediminibacterium goheungense]TDO25395.1 HYR domain-containing protein [Sediminibacterium goheungense]